MKLKLKQNFQMHSFDYSTIWRRKINFLICILLETYSPILKVKMSPSQFTWLDFLGVPAVFCVSATRTVSSAYRMLRLYPPIINPSRTSCSLRIANSKRRINLARKHLLILHHYFSILKKQINASIRKFIYFTWESNQFWQVN